MRIITGLAILLFSCEYVLADPLDARLKSTLRKLGNTPVAISILANKDETGELVKKLHGESAPFFFIDTILTRLSADAVLKLAKDKHVKEIELIDDGLASNIFLILGRLEQLHMYIRTGIHAPASLNISLAPPRNLINSRPSRTAERTIRRAIEAFTVELGLPVAMPVGNDGPALGSVNPWALAQDVILVTATGENGGEIWPQSSRLAPGDKEHFLVAAWGVDIITARDTRYEANLPLDPTIVARFGAEKAATMRYVTGTSFASPQVGKLLCYIHQTESFFRKAISSTSVMDFIVPPHIRGYLDEAIDRNAPQFKYRQVEQRKKYLGLPVTTTPEYKSQIYKAITGNNIDLDLKLRPIVAKKFLLAIAKPLSTNEEKSGIGFIHADEAAKYVANMRVTDLVKLYADSDDPRKDQWITALKKGNNPKLLTPELASKLPDYCSNYDLLLAMPLTQHKQP